jgi:hypothetical protein
MKVPAATRNPYKSEQGRIFVPEVANNFHTFAPLRFRVRFKTDARERIPTGLCVSFFFPSI